MGNFNPNDPKHRDGIKHAVNKPSARMPVREAQHKFDPKQGIEKPKPAPKPAGKPAPAVNEPKAPKSA